MSNEKEKEIDFENLPVLSEEELNAKHEQIMSQTRKKLLYQDYKFFATILFSLRWILDFHCNERALAYIMFNPYNLGEIMSGSIFINSNLLRDPNFKYNNYIFILLHEILHAINGHGYRRGNRNPIIWNLATDHTINIFLKKLCESNNSKPNSTNTISPYGGFQSCFICKELEEKNASIKAEEVYDYIIQNLKNRYGIKKIGSSAPGGSGDGKPDSGSGSPKEDGPNWYEIKDNETGDTYIISDVCSKTASDSGRERELQESARLTKEISKQRGHLPAFLASYLDEILNVELPWEKILESAIKQNVIMKPIGRGWRKINKNLAACGFTLPGIDFDEDKSGVGTCIVTVDVSGSINKEEAMSFAGIIYDAMHYFKTIKVLVHDVDVHQSLTFEADKKDEFLDLIKNTGFIGGGGTSHTPVFGEIQKIYDEDAEGVAIILSLTDGYSNIENIWNTFKWSSEDLIPTYFIITKNGRLLFNKPEASLQEDLIQNNPRQIKINNQT